MRSPSARFAILVVLVVLASGTTSAQFLEQPTLYRLERSSTFQRGCFPPCMCPIMEAAPLRGTFRLELIGIGDVHDFYDVKAVRFRVRRTNTNEDLIITGYGQYKVSVIADLQEMTLELTVGDEPPTTYFSDSVPGGAQFPRIRIPISIHGGFCFDTVLEINARPARRFRVEPDGFMWDPPAESNERYDVVLGDLDALLRTGGAFDVATNACLADGVAGTWWPFTDDPQPGRGFWFLERPEGGSYDDDDAAQVGSADAEIALSPGACP